MISLIDFILNLFRDRGAAADYVAHPEQALLNAGLGNVAPAQLASVAATAVPSLALGAGDPVIGLQRAVANNWGFEPVYAPSPTWSPSYAPQTDFLSGNQTETDLASHNNVPLFSPNQDAGANAQNGAFNLGFGDITLGDKTTASGQGAVAVSGNNSGDILTGDGSALGDNNDVYSGDIHSGPNSNVNYGNGNEVNEGNTAVGHDVVDTHDGTVVQTSGQGTTTSSQGNTEWTAVRGNQTTTNIDGTGNDSGVDNTHTVVDTHTTTTTTSVADNSVHDWGHLPLAGDSSQYSASYDASTHDNTAAYNSANSYDSSVHDNQSTYVPSYDASTHDNTTVQTHQNSHDLHLGF